MKEAHNRNVLTMTSIGTSREGADEDTIRQTLFYKKRKGKTNEEFF